MFVRSQSELSIPIKWGFESGKARTGKTSVPDPEKTLGSIDDSLRLDAFRSFLSTK